MGLDPVTHRPRSHHLNLLSNLQHLISTLTPNNNNPNFNHHHWDNILNTIQTLSPSQLAKLHLLHTLLQVLAMTTTATTNTTSLAQYNLDPLVNSGSMMDQLLSQEHQTVGNFYSHLNLQNVEGLNHHLQQQQHLPQGVVSDGHEFLKMMPCLAAPVASPSSSSLPNLVSPTPHCSSSSSFNKMKGKANQNDDGTPPSTSSTSTFDTLGDFMDEQVSDSFWKHLIE